MDTIAAHSEACCSLTSATKRTARSMTSGEYFSVFFMAPFSQVREPPQNPGRFIVNALDATLGGEYDAFVTKLNPSGTQMLYSTFLGGNNRDYGEAIAVDGAGNAYVTGGTTSTDFPTVNALDATLGGRLDAYVTKFNSSGTQMMYSTFLGGNGGEDCCGIAADGAGNAYVTGATSSTDFHTVNRPGFRGGPVV